MPPYVIERLSPNNLFHFQALYRSIYSKTVSIESLRGKYDTKIFGVAWLGYLAFTADHKPAAFYGVIPCQFKINNEIFLAAQSTNTMTHPDHRNKGLFVNLAKKTYDLARQEGVQFIFGFPNQNSYPGFVKLNWKFMHTPMQLFIKKGSKIPWGALVLKIPILKKVYQWMIGPDSHTVNDHYSSENGVIRDRLFIQHKNQYSKTFIKKWGSVTAWMKNDGSLKVGLLEFPENTSPVHIEKHLKETARKMGCRSIIMMTSSNTKLYKILSQIASPLPALPIGFFNLTERNFDFSQVAFEYCDIDIF